jgi:transcription initiation factor TFIIB
MSFRGPYANGYDEANGKTTPAEECPECSGTLVTEDGETRCIECGLIIDQHRLDRGPETRRFDDDTVDEPAERTGAPLTLARHDRGLSTEIGYKRDAKGNQLSTEKQRRVSRWRREHKRGRYRSKAERNLAHACGELARLASALELPEAVEEEAAAIYREAQAENLIRGRSIETMAAGSLYAACRVQGHPRTVAEIAAVAPCDRAKVELGYGVINRELALETTVLRPQEYIPALASKCEAPDDVHHRALELAHQAEKTGIANGRDPKGVAAACLYLAGRESGHDYTQEELADLADVSAMTLRERFWELREQTL